MANKLLTREDAPIDAKTWDIIDRTMIEAAKNVLVGRRILEVEGPFGLGLKAVPLSDPEVAGDPVTSSILPLALIVRGFSLSKRDIAAFEKDGIFLDTAGVARAAIEVAKLEDDRVFRGTKEAPGLLTIKGSTQVKLTPWEEPGSAIDNLIQALTNLDNEGFHGPYTLALTPNRYNLLLRRLPHGNISELEHIRTMAADGVFKAPALENGGVLIASGKQYASIVLGQDMTVGFIGPQNERLEFNITETAAAYIREPKAICVLKE